MTSCIRILIADRDMFFRAGLRMSLNEVAGFCVVGEATSDFETIEQTTAHQPDVVLISTQVMHNVVESSRQLGRACAASKIVVIEFSDRVQTLIPALQAGVLGYIVRDATAEQMIRCIQVVHQGELWLCASAVPHIRQHVSQASVSQAANAFPELTERECDLLSLIAKGFSNQDIADQIGINLKTVRNHVSNILAKLGVSDRDAAAARARVAGLGRS